MNDLPAGDVSLPLLPLRNSVLFPAAVVPVNVGRKRSVRLIEHVEANERALIVAVAQRSADVEDPAFPDLYGIATLARILKIIRLGSKSYSVVLQGMSRCRIVEPGVADPFLTAKIEVIDVPRANDAVEIEALGLHLREAARRHFERLPAPRRDTPTILDNVQEPGALADLVASNLSIATAGKQAILETFDVRARVRAVLDVVNRQTEVERVRKEISTMVEEEMSRSQRELILRQQLKSIRRELGENDEDEEELEEMRDRVARAQLPPDAEKAARRELRRMSAMASASAEYQVARTYVEWLLDVPFGILTPDKLDVATARRVLDEDHFGLEKPKRRIVEQVAVRKLRRDGRAPILCFIGPPGVGKTSLARSIARAAGRGFERISLGGVADEAEIRGHRRTYVGAFPGRIIAALKKAGSRNPVIVLDEIDKMGSDHRGDPSSALLEVLDPEQNKEFVDHYLDVPVDLSQAMFIATANRRDKIPWALLDRMEVIELPGYTRDEKTAIAREFLVPKQLSEHGISPAQLDFSDEAITHLIDEYTHDAGVRRLEQNVAACCRAVAVELAHGHEVARIADPAFIEKVLGAPKYARELPERVARPGVATGLSWTPAGGSVMLVEATQMPGSGKVQLTGRMGEVMQESVATALSYLRSKAEQLGLPEDFLSSLDVHVHMPEGAVPKDGAAAGLPVLVALASLLTRHAVRPDIGLSGEVTLRGNLLPVSGVKEKCLGAHHAGIHDVVLPERNAPDLEELPAKVRESMHFHLVSHVRDVLPLVLEGELPSARA
jgi:ATP-dependent Lon protease